MDSGEAPEPEQIHATGAGSNAGDEQFVWPWMGVLLNVPTEWMGGWTDGRPEGAALALLPAHGHPSGRPIRPPHWDCHRLVWTRLCLSRQCLGLRELLQGTRAWQTGLGGAHVPTTARGDIRVGCPGDDWRTAGLIGEFLRSHGGLKTIAQLESKMQSEMQKLALLLSTRKNLDKEKKMLQQKPDATQNLEFEIKQLEGQLEVMKQKDSESKRKIDELNKELQEKDDKIEYMESIHGILVTKDLKSNDELQDAWKKLIKGLGDVTSGRTNIGIKRMGDLDSRSFANACKHKMSEIDATIFVQSGRMRLKIHSGTLLKLSLMTAKANRRKFSSRMMRSCENLKKSVAKKRTRWWLVLCTKSTSTTLAAEPPCPCCGTTRRIGKRPWGTALGTSSRVAALRGNAEQSDILQ